MIKGVQKITTGFPQHEMFGLVSQMRRAAVSVPSNIAEGAGRAGAADFTRCRGIARGSLSELETQVVLARELGFLNATGPLDERIDKIYSLLGGLIRATKQ